MVDDRYGSGHGEVYDLWYPDTRPGMVVRLAGLARDGAALELGVGTGRVAIPLAQEGVEVHGVDRSIELLRRLHQRRSKEGVDGKVHVLAGDMVTVHCTRPYQLVYCVGSSLFHLTSRAEQVACIANAARHLLLGGHLVVAGYLPDPARVGPALQWRDDLTFDDDLVLDSSVLDLVGQRVTTQLVRIRPEGVTFHPIDTRFVWPAELDLMARAAGLEPVGVWADWHDTPLRDGHDSYVAQYQLTPASRR